MLASVYKGNDAQAGPQAGAGCVLGLGWRQPAVALRPSPRVKRAASVGQTGLPVGRIVYGHFALPRQTKARRGPADKTLALAIPRL